MHQQRRLLWWLREGPQALEPVRGLVQEPEQVPRQVLLEQVQVRGLVPELALVRLP